MAAVAAVGRRSEYADFVASLAEQRTARDVYAQHDAVLAAAQQEQHATEIAQQLAIVAQTQQQQTALLHVVAASLASALPPQPLSQRQLPSEQQPAAAALAASLAAAGALPLQPLTLRPLTLQPLSLQPYAEWLSHRPPVAAGLPPALAASNSQPAAQMANGRPRAASQPTPPPMQPPSSPPSSGSSVLLRVVAQRKREHANQQQHEAAAAAAGADLALHRALHLPVAAAGHQLAAAAMGAAMQYAPMAAAAAAMASPVVAEQVAGGAALPTLPTLLTDEPNNVPDLLQQYYEATQQICSRGPAVHVGRNNSVAVSKRKRLVERISENAQHYGSRALAAAAFETMRLQLEGVAAERAADRQLREHGRSKKRPRGGTFSAMALAVAVGHFFSPTKQEHDPGDSVQKGSFITWQDMQSSLLSTDHEYARTVQAGQLVVQQPAMQPQAAEE